LSGETNPVEARQDRPKLTLFTIPKGFQGRTDCIQQNAIRSWLQFGNNVEVILFGDDPGVQPVARELGVRHCPVIQRNRFGTPLLSDVFRSVHHLASAETVMYCNSDVILLDDFFQLVTQLQQLQLPRFLGIGRRIDLKITEPIDFADLDQVRRLKIKSQQEGTVSSIVCKEFFVFPKGIFETIPEFAVGRGNWDNWMVRNAKQRKIPVVSLSPQAWAIHQAHDYSHLNSAAGSRQRWHCYVSGDEAKVNQQLAGGQHLISGSTADWKLESGKLRKHRLGGLNLDFWLDLPRFARLVGNLIKTG